MTADGDDGVDANGDDGEDEGEGGSTSMTVTVRLFANLREAVGAEAVEIAAAPDDAAVDVIARLGDDEPAMRDMVFDGDGGLRSHVNVTVDGEDVEPDESIGDATELAVFPPVTGGAVGRDPAQRVVQAPSGASASLSCTQ